MLVKRILAYGLPALCVLLFTLLLIAFVGRQDSACSQVEALRTVVRTILTEGQTAALKSNVYTPNQRVVAVKFYSDALALLAPHHC